MLWNAHNVIYFQRHLMWNAVKYIHCARFWGAHNVKCCETHKFVKCFEKNTVWNALKSISCEILWRAHSVKCETMRGIKYKRWSVCPAPLNRPAYYSARSRAPSRNLRRSFAQSAVVLCAGYDCAVRAMQPSANRSPHTVIDSWASRNFLLLCTSNVVFNLTKIVKRKRS